LTATVAIVTGDRDLAAETIRAVPPGMVVTVYPDWRLRALTGDVVLLGPDVVKDVRERECRFVGVPVAVVTIGPSLAQVSPGVLEESRIDMACDVTSVNGALAVAGMCVDAAKAGAR
jgi:hypothetical protein